MEKSSVGLAVLGCGYWGKNLVRNFRDLGVLRMVCDVSQKGCELAAEIAPNVDCTKRFEDAFENKNISAVVLATPAETHESLAIKALESGKDVFVEKPMALTVEQGIRMKRKAESLERILMVGHILEYHPAVERLRGLISEGVLGETRYIFSNRLNFGKIRTEENALWSFAPHDIAVILRLFGELPKEVTCIGGSYVTSNLADVTVSCLHFGSGKRAHIFVSWLNPFKEQKLVVVGEEKMAVFNDIEEKNKLQLFNQRVENSESQPILHKGDIETVLFEEAEPLKRECAHFIQCVETRSQPRTDAANGLAVLSVLEACQLSMGLEGRPVPVKGSDKYEG